MATDNECTRQTKPLEYLRRGGVLPIRDPLKPGAVADRSPTATGHRPAVSVLGAFPLAVATTVPHTLARACMGCVGANTDLSTNRLPEKTGACRGPGWKGKAARPSNDPSKGEVRDVGTYVQWTQLLKSSGFDDPFLGYQACRNEWKQGGFTQPLH